MGTIRRLFAPLTLVKAMLAFPFAFVTIVTIVLCTSPNGWAADNRPLKVALLPILDSLPFYVAETKGHFNRNAVAVKAVPVASALERDQLMQSGAIDGMLNEMMSTASFNRDQVKVQIVMAARRAYPQYPLFRVLAAPGSGIDKPQKLTGVAVGVSKNTIIEYVTDRLLQAEQLKAGDIKNKSVPVIPERFQLLIHGQLSAATLPDPLAKSAMETGAILVIDDAKYPRYSMSVLSFDLQALQQRPDEVRNFLKAWDQATADINANPENYRGLLLQKIRVPKNIQATFPIPPYPRKELPDEDQWADVMAWMVNKGLLESPLMYRPSVTNAYLPQ